MYLPTRYCWKARHATGSITSSSQTTEHDMLAGHSYQGKPAGYTLVSQSRILLKSSSAALPPRRPRPALHTTKLRRRSFLVRKCRWQRMTQS